MSLYVSKQTARMDKVFCMMMSLDPGVFDRPRITETRVVMHVQCRVGGCDAEASEGNQSKRDILCHPNGAHPSLQHGTVLLHHSTCLLHRVHSGELMNAVRYPAHTCMHCLGRCSPCWSANCLDACCHCAGGKTSRFLQLCTKCSNLTAS